MCLFTQYFHSRCMHPATGPFIHQPCEHRCGLGVYGWAQATYTVRTPYRARNRDDVTEIYLDSSCKECRRGRDQPPQDPYVFDYNRLSTEDIQRMQESSWYLPSVHVSNSHNFREIAWHNHTDGAEGDSASSSRSDSGSVSPGGEVEQAVYMLGTTELQEPPEERAAFAECLSRVEDYISPAALEGRPHGPSPPTVIGFVTDEEWADMMNDEDIEDIENFFPPCRHHSEQPRRAPTHPLQRQGRLSLPTLQTRTYSTPNHHRTSLPHTLSIFALERTTILSSMGILDRVVARTSLVPAPLKTPLVPEPLRITHQATTKDSATPPREHTDVTQQSRLRLRLQTPAIAPEMFEETESLASSNELTRMVSPAHTDTRTYLLQIVLIWTTVLLLIWFDWFLGPIEY